MVREALETAGVPAVINGAGSVFGTDAARQWLRLIEALERPASLARAHSAALTGFVGWSAASWPADDAPDATDESGSGRRSTAGCTSGRACCATRGVAALLETITASRATAGAAARRRRRRAQAHRSAPHRAAAARRRVGRAARARPRWPRGCGTRIAEASRRGRRGAQPPAGVRRRGRAGADDPPQQGARVPDRLRAVPVGRADMPSERPDPCSSTTPAADASTLDVALEGTGYGATTRARSSREQRGEDLRLAYVALTRARHQAVVWWAGSLGQPQLAARPAAVRPRRGGRRRPAVGYVARRRGDARATGEAR